ncbi:MAG: hypothetical protein ACREAM_06340, partial [Blastocatellia bacterium]
MWEEYFTVVKKVEEKDPVKTKVIPCGCVSRDIAHSPAKVPHASVQVIPVRSSSGKIIMHQRPDFKGFRTAVGKWDVLGGHVTFEMGVLSENGLELASFETAVREAREEMLVTFKNEAYLLEKKYFSPIGDIGQFECNDATNAEYSTAFVLAIPENAIVST